MKSVPALLVVSALLAYPVHAGAETLYAATAAGQPGTLYIIDPATAAVVQDVGPLNDAANVNYPITGLAFHPTTHVLYGSTANNPEATASRLVTIDPLTAEVTVIGIFDPGNMGMRDATMGDLAFDSAGNLFGVGTVGGPQLYSIDIATGQATVIGGTGLTSASGAGLAISSTGVFYGTPTASRFGTYDAVSGTYADIGNPAKPAGGGAYGALDFDENGVLYGLNVGSGSPPPTHLVTIVPASAAVTDVGASVTALDAIAFGPAPCELSCPEDITVSATELDCGAEVPYEDAEAAGAACGTVSCLPPSGGLFLPLGETSVTCSETGVNAMCSFTVTVQSVATTDCDEGGCLEDGTSAADCDELVVAPN